MAISAEVSIQLLSASEGGRTAPLSLNHPTAHYRPHFVVGDISQRTAILDSNGRGVELYLGVEFRRAELELMPGDSATLWVEFMFAPAPEYDRLVPGVTFTIREGPKVVGFGEVLRCADAV